MNFFTNSKVFFLVFSKSSLVIITSKFLEYCNSLSAFSILLLMVSFVSVFLFSKRFLSSSIEGGFTKIAKLLSV